MKRHFFRRHEGRGSYDLFSSYTHFLPGAGETVTLLILFLVGALLGNLVTLGLGAILGEQFIGNYGMLISYPTMFIPAMLYASAKSRLNEYTTPEVTLDKGLGKGKRCMTLVAAGIFSTIAAAYAIEPVTALLPPMPEWLEETMKGLLENTPFWATLISVSVMAPLFEEWLCRGLILRGLLQKSSPLTAIVVSALIFAVIHMNPWQAIPAFCLGLLFGYVYYKTGSLKLTILMHCANNTMAALCSRIPEFKDAETFMDVLSPWAYCCIYAACLLIIACTIVILKNIPLYPAHGESVR
jgi:membrane protease YdiL (CAAX protease family)